MGQGLVWVWGNEVSAVRERASPDLTSSLAFAICCHLSRTEGLWMSSSFMGRGQNPTFSPSSQETQYSFAWNIRVKPSLKMNCWSPLLKLNILMVFPAAKDSTNIFSPFYSMPVNPPSWLQQLMKMGQYQLYLFFPPLSQSVCQLYLSFPRGNSFTILCHRYGTFLRSGEELCRL